MILDKDKLFETGYLSFNLKDLDEELFDDIQSQFTNDTLKKFINNYRFDQRYHPKDLPYMFEELIEKNFNLDSIQIQSNVHEKTQTKFRGNFQGKLSELKKLDEYLSEYPWIKDGQQWFHGPLDIYGQKTFKQELIGSLYNTTIKKLYKDYIKNTEDYSDDYNGPNNILRSTDVTMYLQDGYITPHEDGYDEGRLCVMLMYMNEDYDYGYGGEIIVNGELTVEPKEGNIVILDFLHNNIEHEVLPIIKNGFERFAL